MDDQLPIEYYLLMAWRDGDMERLSALVPGEPGDIECVDNKYTKTTQAGKKG